MFKKTLSAVVLLLALLFFSGFLLPFLFWEISTPSVWSAWEIAALGASLSAGTGFLLKKEARLQTRPLSLRTLAVRKIVVIQKTLFVVGILLLCWAAVISAIL